MKPTLNVRKVVEGIGALALAVLFLSGIATSSAHAAAIGLNSNAIVSSSTNGSFQCYVVTNKSLSNSLFVPTGSVGEWNAFIANAPTSLVGLSPCTCAASGGCSAGSPGTVCTSYTASAVTSPTVCASVAVTSTCTNGSWTVTPAANASCAQGYRSCAASGGCSATANGGTCTSYTSSSPSGAACSTVAVSSTCNDGTWSVAPATYGSCSNGCAASGACGASSSGGTCSTNASSALTYPSVCAANVTSTCSNGTWSPAPNAYGSCTQNYTYAWYQSGFGSCSTSCGTGTQSQTVYCRRNDGTQVADANCTGTKPAASQGCSVSSGCVHTQGSACSLTSSANSCGQTNTTSGTWSYDVCSAATPSVPANPAGYGNSCTSSANSCGQTNTGTIQCNGSCSASTPSNPAGYGNSCTSSANACGQTNSGTIQCNGSCSASTPSNPAGYGNSCTSSANSCGQTNSGTIQCNGSCSASTPSNPAGYGNSCTSSANSCGQTSSGTIQCNGTCSASTPAIPGPQSCSACNGAGCNYGTTDSCGNNCNAVLPYFCWSSPGGCIYGTTAGSPAGTNVCQASDPSFYGQSCSLGTSAANACGQTQSCTGVYNCAQQCYGTCNAPANSCTFSWTSAQGTCGSMQKSSTVCVPYSYPYSAQYMYFAYQTPVVTCVRSNDGATVADSNCDPNTKPTTSPQVCGAMCTY